MKENQWHYNLDSHIPGQKIYEMSFNLTNSKDFNLPNCSLRVRVYVEAAPKMCRMEALLPVKADRTYEYPLCLAIAKANAPKRLGAIKYNERSGELTYDYSFLISHGVYPDDLSRVFHAVVSSAAKMYADIRKCCVGRFTSTEINEILTKVNALLIDISEM